MNQRRIIRLLTLGLVLFVAAAGCSLLETSAPTPTTPPTAAPAEEVEQATTEPTAEPEPTATQPPAPTEAAVAEPTAEPELVEEPAPLPEVVDYNLGDAIIIQDWFAEGAMVREMPLREMPVRLNGLIAIPTASQHPSPVVVILHGTHPGCPVVGEVDFWPCEPDEEQANYRGFDYLVQRLAAEGYVALSLNINAVNTFGYGEAASEENIGSRLTQLVDLHLKALAAAADGGENAFGVDLADRVDVSRLVFIGHSRGGENVNWLIRNQGLNTYQSLAINGYGPAYGQLLVAPAVANFVPQSAGVPTSVVLPACDGDVINHDGQILYDTIRLDPEATEWATSVWLEAANHNYFNSILSRDMVTHTDRPECQTLLTPEEQQTFLADYASGFAAAAFAASPPVQLDALAELGLDVESVPPVELFGRAVRLMSHAAADDRLTFLRPADAAGLTTNLLGGGIRADNLATSFCPAGYFLGEDVVNFELCRRRGAVNIPGFPALMVASWDSSNAALQLEIPDTDGDFSRYTTLSLRAAIDPLSPLSVEGQSQSFTVRLTDAAGGVAAVVVGPEEPALQYPPGQIAEDEFRDGPFYTSFITLSTIRLPLAVFTGIDLTSVSEVALVFDQTESGTLFMSDIELVRPPHVIGAYSTLLENADGVNDPLKGIGRFDGQSDCTGTFINTGGNPDAPAYIISNGHCAQSWEANAVFLDQPADGWSMTFNYFVDTLESAIQIPVAEVAYSSMKSRDISIIELDATMGELMEQGIMPLDFAVEEPVGIWTMSVIGAPVTGVPNEIAYLREEQCLAAAERPTVFEFFWHFDNAFRNSCQDIYGGSSGSPVFVAGVPGIVGLINTTNLGALTPCYLGAPCESTPEGTFFRPDTSYATPVVGLDACFDDEGLFDVAAAGCPLDAGRQLDISGVQSQGRQPETIDLDGNPAPASWNATLRGELPYYRYKTGPVGQVDCLAEEGYGTPIALADADLINDPLPSAEGSYLLCVVAGESPVVDETWQPVEQATILRAEIDITPPTVEPVVGITSTGDGNFLLEPIFAIAEMTDFLLKIGPAAETDCVDREDYQRYRRIPVGVSPDILPARVCVIGFDYAGNEAPPYEVILEIP